MKIAKFLLAGMAVAAAIQTAQADDQRIHMIMCGDNAHAGVPLQAEVIRKWEAENDGYTVDVEFVPWGQCQEKAITLASAGTPPAIAYMGSRTLKQLAENGLIIPVDMSEEEKATYAPPILATITADGQQWGLPRGFTTQALFWNKDLFEAAGLDPENPPTTWDELYETARAISDNTDANGMGLAAASFDNTMHQFLNYVYSNGGEVINEEGNIVFDSPNNVEALAFYEKLAGVAQPGATAYDLAQLVQLFSQEQVAMVLSGAWTRERIGDFDWGVSRIPAGPNGVSGTLLITDSLAVFNNTGVEEQALSLAKLLTNPQNQLAFDLAVGMTPLRDMPEVQELTEADPFWIPFIEAIPFGGPEPFVTDYIALQDAINEAVQGVVLGEVSPQEAIEFAAEELEYSQ